MSTFGKLLSLLRPKSATAVNVNKVEICGVEDVHGVSNRSI